MRPVQTIALTADGNSLPVVLDPLGFSNSTSLTLIITGTLTAKVQFTNDDVFDPAWTPGSANWFDHPTLNGKTSSDVGNFAVPIAAIRCVVSGYSSGSAYVRAIQSQNNI